MKLKFILAAFISVAFGAATVMADAVLTVNGSKVEKGVTRLAFDGDYVKVTFSDNSESAFDMGEVALSFIPSAGVGSISSISTLTVSVGDILEISGIKQGCVIQVYDLQGQLCAQAVSSGDTNKINISSLDGGAYILKAGNEIVKFLKH